MQEMLRNECLLLLVNLVQEVRSHSKAILRPTDHCWQSVELQKIASMNNVFERLFDIIEEEEYVGVIVHDCLQLCRNLLLNNDFTQRYFRKELLFMLLVLSASVSTIEAGCSR